MERMPMTQHAQARLRQRGIPPDALAIPFEYGVTMHDHYGAEVLYMTRAGRQSVLRSRGRQAYKRLEPTFNVYAVIDSDGRVITVGHRTRRINRP
jgi:hypothetical protein